MLAADQQTGAPVRLRLVARSTSARLAGSDGKESSGSPLRRDRVPRANRSRGRPTRDDRDDRSGPDASVVRVSRWTWSCETALHLIRWRCNDWLAEGFDPINQAWSWIEMIGSAEAIDAARQLLDACTEVVTIATEIGGAHARFSSLVGMEWTSGQAEALEAAAKRVVERAPRSLHLCSPQ